MRPVAYQFTTQARARLVRFSLEAAAPATAVPALRRQTPPMAVVDEAIMLLHTAAEIEHGLMVQYLYEAFSLPDTALQSGCAETC